MRGQSPSLVGFERGSVAPPPTPPSDNSASVSAQVGKGHPFVLLKQRRVLVVGFFFFFYVTYGFPGGKIVNNPPAIAGDTGNLGLIPGWGKSPGGRHGNPSQYSCLENPWTEEPGRLLLIGSQRVGCD